ncbi:MAG: DUF177 domain-containing protein [Anaerolineae bacterium]
MHYNVSQLLKSPTGAVRHYKIHEDISDLDPTILPLSTLDGEIQMIRTADGILVSGNLYTTVELSCGRCLEMFAMPNRFAIEEEFRPTIDVITGAKISLTPDDESETLIDARHMLDLREVIRQDLLLALPMYPVCRSKCRGLCPNCGQNWNEAACNCSLEEIDPRLAVLKRLLQE